MDDSRSLAEQHWLGVSIETVVYREALLEFVALSTFGAGAGAGAATTASVTGEPTHLPIRRDEFHTLNPSSHASVTQAAGAGGVSGYHPSDRAVGAARRIRWKAVFDAFGGAVERPPRHGRAGIGSRFDRYSERTLKTLQVDEDTAPDVPPWHPAPRAARNQAVSFSTGKLNEQRQIIDVSGNGDGVGDDSIRPRSLAVGGACGVVGMEFALKAGRARDSGHVSM